MTQLNDDIKTLLLHLFDRINDIEIRSEAMRVLLVQSGSFPQEDFDNAVTYLKSVWEKRFQSELSTAEQNAASARLRKLLEGFEGTEQ